MVYKEFDAKKHIWKNWHYREDLPVYLGVDPGYGDDHETAYAIEVVQIYDGKIHVIDEIYKQKWRTEAMINECKQRPWWQNPDILLYIDPYAAKTHQYGQDAVSETWEKLTHLRNRTVQRIRIHDGIERMKFNFRLDDDGNPRILIAPHCRGVLSEAGACYNPFTQKKQVYTYNVDEEGSAYAKDPLNKYNHGFDALTYLTIGALGFTSTDARRRRTSGRWRNGKLVHEDAPSRQRSPEDRGVGGPAEDRYVASQVGHALHPRTLRLRPGSS